MKKKDPRVVHYSQVLSKLRLVMISQMAKPEEVTIVENENGEVVRETLKDTDMITLYKTMREALIYLTNLDPDETPSIMLQKLEAQVDGREYSWHNLNTLCWAIGSISGALSERNEKHFLVSAIRSLLSLCEIKRGKSHKAIVASNIMYVVGQYPRFLKNHWRFLKTVVNKLFEFMHEKFEGVQQMACETFLKIALKCRNQFVVPQLPEDPVPFIETILENLGEIIRDLEAQDIHTFYEALGHIVRSESRQDVRQRLVLKMMELPNQGWASFVAMGNSNPHLLWDMKHIREIKKILRTNRAVAAPVGEAFIVQMSRIYVEMLKLYEVYSQYVSDRLREQGMIAAESSVVRGIRSVKSDILLLIKAFVENGGALNRQVICENFLPLLLEVVLSDYSTSIPATRDASVLLVFGAIIDTMSEAC
jgi:exportin-1